MIGSRKASIVTTGVMFSLITSIIATFLPPGLSAISELIDSVIVCILGPYALLGVIIGDLPFTIVDLMKFTSVPFFVFLPTAVYPIGRYMYFYTAMVLSRRLRPTLGLFISELLIPFLLVLPSLLVLFVLAKVKGWEFVINITVRRFADINTTAPRSEPSRYGKITARLMIAVGALTFVLMSWLSAKKKAELIRRVRKALQSFSM